MYDRELLTPDGSSKVARKPTRPVPSVFVPDDPPDVLSDEASLPSWQKLFRERRAWAIQISQDCDAMVQQIHECRAEIDMVRKGTAIAADNARQHVESLQQKNDEAQRWADDVLQDQDRLLADHDGMLQKFDAIKIHESLGRLFTGKNLTKHSWNSDRSARLANLADLSEVSSAKRRSTGAADGLRTRLEVLQSSYEDIVHDSKDLTKQIQSRFEALNEDTSQVIGDLAEELEGTVRQISSDYENTLTLQNNARTVAAVSKTALLHTRKFLPSLSEIAIDIGDLLKKTVERRNSVEETALNFMQRIASIESTVASVQSLIRGVDLSPEEGQAMDVLSRVSQIPYIYASLLVEVVRRQEWTQKMMTDSSTLAEEMAMYRDEEEKKRKKWLKSMGKFLHQDALTSRAKGIEVSVQGQDQNAPNLSRDDISHFVSDLESAGGFEELLQELAELVKSLDAPTKQQARRTSAFRKGAITDSVFGRSSLLLRGDDELVQSLQNEKSKLEDRLKGSESRIRKLEDLLHRSSQMNRPFPGSVPIPGLQVNQPSPALDRNGSLPGANYATSPKRNELISRRSSVASHRTSLADGHEEINLAQRIVQLEADLANERKRNAKFEESALRQVTEQDELRAQVQDATSMKKDLMDNFDAQRHEFDAERRLLNDENRKLKLRIEEMEEDFDRVLGSHDNARAVFDERARTHEAEIEKVRKAALESARKAEDEIGNLQAIKDNQSNRLEMLETDLAQKISEISSLEAAVSDLKRDAKSKDEAQSEQQRALLSAHSALDPDAACSDTFETLIQDLELLAQKAADHQRVIQVALDSVQADNDALDARMKDQDKEISRLRERLAGEEQDTFTLREETTAQKARNAALKEELETERKALATLRSKVYSTETGSESLRGQLIGEEKKIESLSTELASIKATNNEADKELVKRLRKIELLQASHDSANLRLHDRARRAGDISLQLYLLTDRLMRLLEHIGYAVSRQDDTMVLQRLPRTGSANNTTNEPSQAMNRSLSGPVPTHLNEEPPSYLHWASAEDAEQEHHYFEAFLNESKAFDMDAFSEAVVKRVKEADHTARKWQREAKSHRDKFRTAHFEAQHKIAFRSFKEGDLALFLPTRNQAPQRSWAAFNVGAPHYFLREQEFHHLNSRDWLLARINKVEDRVVDLSKGASNGTTIGAVSDDGASIDDDNPFGLSDGLRWYYLDAAEENLGAPIALGPARTTVASVHVDAAGSIERNKKMLEQGAATRTLTKSLDSRRSSANSKKSIVGAAGSPALATGIFENHAATSTPTATAAAPEPGAIPSTDSAATVLPKPPVSQAQSVIPEEVRKDQLLDP